MGKKLLRLWRASQDVAHVHWLAGPLAGLVTWSSLEWITDEPLSFTIPAGVAVAAVIVLTIAGVRAFNSMEAVNSARAKAIEEWASSRHERRVKIVEKARRRIAAYDSSDVGGFLPWIERHPEFFDIQPHIDKARLAKARKDCRVMVIVRDRGYVDPGKTWFVSEVDRIARKWGVD